MSKPMTKNQIATIKANANGNETVLALLAEVERLKKLARPNRKPKTRNVIRHIDTVSKIVYYTERGGDWNPMENPNYGKVCPCKDCESKRANESESYGKKIYSKNKVDGDGYSVNDPSRERY